MPRRTATNKVKTATSTMPADISLRAPGFPDHLHIAEPFCHSQLADTAG
ncbi:hypothetical protein [Bradyrhizobium sp. RDM4]